jgi:hypothetical protein
MSSATNATKPRGIHDAWQPRGVTAALGANDALLRSVAAQAEAQKTMAQLAKPLLGVSMEKMFPTATFARQLKALQMPDMTKVLGVGGVGASMEKLLPTADLSRQLDALRLPDMTKALGVAGVASMGVAEHVKAAQQASLYSRTSVAGIAGIESKRLLAELSSVRAEMARVGVLSDSLSTGLARSYHVTALTRGLSADVASVARSLGVSAFGVQGVLPAMPKFAAETLEEARIWTESIERFSRRWEQSALWFMLSSLSIEHGHRMADMEPAEVEHDLLRALEAIVTEGGYAQALSSALDKAPHVTDVQRDHLQHGLEHAQRGEFERAIPPLMHGMEGALWSTARALSVIDAKRRLVNRPRMPRARSIEPVIRELPTGEGFATFVIHRVFGGSGNVVRHGELGGDGRQRALFLVVAVAGWLDAVMEVPAHEVLGHMLSEQLSADWRSDR